MWFLITFEVKNFVRIITYRAATNFKFVGYEEKKPIYYVSEDEKYYNIEYMGSDSKICGYLTDKSKLNSLYFIVLNHCCVLLQYNDEVKGLAEKISFILKRKDKFANFPISEMAASNFLEVSFVNKMLTS